MYKYDTGILNDSVNSTAGIDLVAARESSVNHRIAFSRIFYQYHFMFSSML